MAFIIYLGTMIKLVYRVGLVAAFAALLASGCASRGLATSQVSSPYGPLVPDPQGLLDLPRSFSYRVIARLGDVMDDGWTVPDLTNPGELSWHASRGK